MASSKVMASSSTSSTNPDLVRQSSTYSQLTIGDLQSDPSKNFGSMSMDELIRNIYGDNPPPPPSSSSSDMIIIPTPPPAAGVTSTAPSLPRQGSFPPLPRDVASKTVDEVWKEISGGSSSNNNNINNNNNNGDGNMIRDDIGEEEEEAAAGGGAAAFNEMTLEEFLTKAGAVGEEDMKIPQMVGPVHGFVVDPALDARYPPQHQGESAAAAAASGSGSILWLGNGGDRAGGGRGKRRAVLEPIDKVAQQRQRRMIKNRESAARSRERKQAYTVELESLVTQLEEENARLQREQVERNRERYKQLMENLIPVEEKRKPQTRRVLRRASSTHW